MIRKILKILGVVILHVVLHLSIAYLIFNRAPQYANVSEDMLHPELQSMYDEDGVIARLLS
mgnify:CR=1 FL=1